MPLDGVYIYNIVRELKTLLINGRVEKVNQPEKDEIVLTIKNQRTNYRLLISASSVYPKIHITNNIKKNPLTAPMFCMVLRKYLNTAKVVDIRQLDCDRVIFIDFENTDELGFNSIYTLAVEIMGRHSNISLVRSRDSIIMESIKHVTPEISSVRSLYTGIKYELPPASQKLSPLNYTYEQLDKYVLENSIKFESNFFSKVFTGVSTPFSKELVFEIKKAPIDFQYNDLDKISQFVGKVFLHMKNGISSFYLYYEGDKVKDFYCFPLESIKYSSIKKYGSPSKLIEDFYFERDKADRLKNKSSDLQKLLHVNIERCEKKLQILNKTLDDCSHKDKYKLYGELLTANIYSLKSEMDSAQVQNYYSDNYELITIPLEKGKSPSHNIQKYYKKYNKMKKSEEAAAIQIQLTEDELNYLQSVLTNVKNADDYDSIDEIKRELIETGYIKFKKNSNIKKKSSSKPYHFVSSDGTDIYVGKNNFQNDYLTLKFASNKDLWFHTKKIPGSHVIVKNMGTITPETINEAAQLAAYYSKAKDSSKVPVDYTEVKNVHKPNGAKPGMVIYYTNKTVYVNPNNRATPKIKE
ncbi:NFACT RNA binding domain-containing protein [Clostridium sp. JN-9]|uniref:Rqc2 family fibronectin-binding protein n=1 Tax=Clostridium sp. JN-9 TaxID=2507159 RepID=UPI000FFE26D9|nr:NFACT RNA binding domain-containing protein [Clostridium sp. JN-9]QAT40033.1 fibronectin/fibrinogen-binding protein [Clostridium sp. JN-9]